MNAARLAVCLTLVLCACGTPTEPEASMLQSGWWSGGTDLQVRESDVILYLTCGAGTFSRPVLDRSGSFRVDGRVSISIGPPPLPLPGIPSGAPATFAGQLSGSTLTVTMNSAHLNHTFTFHFEGVGARSEPPTVCP